MRLQKPKVRVYSNQDEMSNQGGVSDMNKLFASSQNDEDEMMVHREGNGLVQSEPFSEDDSQNSLNRQSDYQKRKSFDMLKN